MAGANVGLLKKMLPKRYKHRRLIAHEISSVISEFKYLTPEMEVYVFSDGTSRNQIHLSGMVPVCYMGKHINVPVCVWLLDSYPKHPPISFVKPTKDMMIVPGQYIDANGQIYLPYLQDWSYPQSDLFGLIQVMTVVFGEEPPVCVRTPTQPAPAFVPENSSSSGEIPPALPATFQMLVQHQTSTIVECVFDQYRTQDIDGACDACMLRLQDTALAFLYCD